MSSRTNQDDSFLKEVKYKIKDDQNKFNIKYEIELVNEDSKDKNKLSLQKKTEQGRRKTLSKKHKEQPAQKQCKKSPKKFEKPKKQKAKVLDVNEAEFEEFKKYNKVNHKKMKNGKNDQQKQKKQTRHKSDKKLLKDMSDLDQEGEWVEEYEEGIFAKDSSSDWEDQDQIRKSGKQMKEGKWKKKEYSKEKQKIEKYEPYLSIKQIEKSRQKGENKFFKGTVDFSERIKWFGKIYSKQKDGDLIIERRNQNRCIHDDEVYFQVLEGSKEAQKIKCKVVAILPWKTNKTRQVVGKLQYNHRNKTYFLVPINKRIITLNVQQTKEFSKLNKKNKDNKYFLAEILGWEIDEEYPECRIIEEYGKMGEIETETGALLVTHGVIDEEYDEDKVQKGLQKFIDRIDNTGEYAIEKEEIDRRLDLRKHDIFTIDPLTARDFDDALSVDPFGEHKGRKVYEIGVHIADASFFVEENGIIDKIAQQKTTSVYLVHRVIPMLPRILCETMCSLNPGLERLTLSIWFKVTEDGEILPGSRYDRSVIKSKARFTYEQAQSIIEKKVQTQNQIEKGFGCVDEEDFDKIAADICLMNELTMRIRQNRIKRGSLIFQLPKKSFQLDENYFPTAYTIKQRCASNFLVEELMLLANQKVGQVLIEHIRPQALLRRHRFPGEKKIEKFENFTKKINQSIKVTKQIKIQEKLNQIMNDPKVKKCIKQILNYELIFLLEMAEYFVVQDVPKEEWVHYALSMPVYTHFTSPIRRYPDIIVHRQLCAIIDAEKTNSHIHLHQMQNQNLKQLVKRCNKNKLSAKRVSTGCEKVFLCLYLKKDPVMCKAILTGVTEWGFNISIPDYDFRYTMQIKQLQQMKMMKFGKDRCDRSFMEVECGKEDKKINLVLREMQQVSVRLSAKEGFPIDYLVHFVFPDPKNPTQMVAYD